MQQGQMCGLHAANYVRKRLGTAAISACPLSEQDEKYGFDIGHVKNHFFDNVTFETTPIYSPIYESLNFKLTDNLVFLREFTNKSDYMFFVLCYSLLNTINPSQPRGHFVAIEKTIFSETNRNEVWFVLADSMMHKTGTRLFDETQIKRYLGERRFEGAFGVKLKRQPTPNSPPAAAQNPPAAQNSPPPPSPPPQSLPAPSPPMPSLPASPPSAATAAATACIALPQPAPPPPIPPPPPPPLPSPAPPGLPDQTVVGQFQDNNLFDALSSFVKQKYPVRRF